MFGAGLFLIPMPFLSVICSSLDSPWRRNRNRWWFSAVRSKFRSGKTHPVQLERGSKFKQGPFSCKIGVFTSSISPLKHRTFQWDNCLNEGQICLLIIQSPFRTGPKSVFLSVAIPAEPRGDNNLFLCKFLGGEKLLKKCRWMFKQPERGFKIFGHVSYCFSDLFFFAFFKPSFVSNSNFFRGQFRSADVPP